MNGGGAGGRRRHSRAGLARYAVRTQRGSSLRVLSTYSTRTVSGYAGRKRFIDILSCICCSRQPKTGTAERERGHTPDAPHYLLTTRYDGTHLVPTHTTPTHQGNLAIVFLTGGFFAAAGFSAGAFLATGLCAVGGLQRRALGGLRVQSPDRVAELLRRDGLENTRFHQRAALPVELIVPGRVCQLRELAGRGSTPYRPSSLETHSRYTYIDHRRIKTSHFVRRARRGVCTC